MIGTSERDFVVALTKMMDGQLVVNSSATLTYAKIRGFTCNLKLLSFLSIPMEFYELRVLCQ